MDYRVLHAGSLVKKNSGANCFSNGGFKTRKNTFDLPAPRIIDFGGHYLQNNFQP
jgi:hypothetical protein